MAMADSGANTVRNGEDAAGRPYVLLVLSAIDEDLRQPWLASVIAETVRQTFDRCESVTSLHDGRLLAVVERDPFTENRIQEVDWLLRRRLPARCFPKIDALDLPGES